MPCVPETIHFISRQRYSTITNRLVTLYFDTLEEAERDFVVKDSENSIFVFPLLNILTVLIWFVYGIAAC